MLSKRARCRLEFIGVAILLLTTHSLCAQTITIKVLDGRNGRPMGGEIIDVWLGDHANGRPVQVRTGHDGMALLPVSRDQQTFVVAGEFLGRCRPLPNNSSKTVVDSNVYRFADVETIGVVSQNTCGKASSQPVPGQLIYFARPLHWWEKMQT